MHQQALTKAYSLHDFMSVGISNKSEFHTAKMAHFITFMVEFRPDMHQAFMVTGHYTKYSV